MLRLRLIPASLLMLLAGCATVITPPEDLPGDRPVIEMGSQAPDHKEYVLHIPAQTEIPVRLLVKGSVFTGQGHAQTSVRLKREIYLYKYWASYDGQTWQRSHDLFETQVAVGVETTGGEVQVIMNRRERKQDE